MLAHYETIEAIPDDPEDWQVAVRGAKRLAANLAESRDDALLFKKLATLAEDAPIHKSLSDLEWRGAPREIFQAWCGEMAVDRLRERPVKWL